LKLLGKIYDSFKYADGGSYKGWLIGLCEDLEDLEDRYNWRKTFYVKPYWAFYHK